MFCYSLMTAFTAMYYFLCSEKKKMLRDAKLLRMARGESQEDESPIVV